MTPSWFYILRPACSSIAVWFCDCTRIAIGLWIAMGLVVLFWIAGGVSCAVESIVAQTCDFTFWEGWAEWIGSGASTFTVGGSESCCGFESVLVAGSSWRVPTFGIEFCLSRVWRRVVPSIEWCTDPEWSGTDSVPVRWVPRPGSIFSGPLVLPLRLDSMIAPGLRGDYGLCWTFWLCSGTCCRFWIWVAVEMQIGLHLQLDYKCCTDIAVDRQSLAVLFLVPIIFLPILPLGLCYDSKVAWGFRVAVKIGCIALGLCKTV